MRIQAPPILGDGIDIAPGKTPLMEEFVAG
jgi:hypothetical protein